MGKVIAGLAVTIFGALGIGFMLFLGAVMGTAFGALSGFFVGWLFDGSMAILIGATGLDAEPYQLGAILGFLGGFIRTSISTK